jgi:hypothetical protein
MRPGAALGALIPRLQAAVQAVGTQADGCCQTASHANKAADATQGRGTKRVTELSPAAPRILRLCRDGSARAVDTFS